MLPLNSDVRRHYVAMNVLFVCGKNRLRSPTAEQVFASTPGLEVDSAGLSADADNRLTTEQVLWADVIFVMEKQHRRKLSSEFRPDLKGKRVVCLDIPDNFGFMDPPLIQLLRVRVPRHLAQISNSLASSKVARSP